MPLTPQDVRDKVFTPTRFKNGYDENEVDVFLDEVEAELGRLLGQVEQLKGELSRAGQGPDVQAGGQADSDPEAVRVAVASALAEAATDAESAKQEALREAARAHAAELTALRDDQAEQLTGLRAERDELRAQLDERPGDAESRATSGLLTTTPVPAASLPLQDVENHPQVVAMTESLQRTLVLAQRTADEVLAQARRDAEETTAAAQAEAATTRAVAQEELEEAREEVVRLRAEATEAREAAVASAREEAAATLSGLEGRRASLQDDVDRLATYEAEHRRRLEEFLHRQLTELGTLSNPAPSDAGTLTPGAEIDLDGPGREPRPVSDGNLSF